MAAIRLVRRRAVATVLVARALAGRTGFRASLPRVVFAFAVAPFSFLMLSTVVPAHAFHGERLLHAVDTAMFFGVNPNVALDRLAWPPLTELLQLVYAFYYAIPFVMLFAFVVERRPGALSRGLLTVLSASISPTSGTSCSRRPGRTSTASGSSRRTSAPRCRGSGSRRSCARRRSRPSGSSTIAGRRGTRRSRSPASRSPGARGSRAFRILLVPVALLVFSTMYLRYHYVIDVVCGVGLAWLTLRYAPRLHARFFDPASAERGR